MTDANFGFILSKYLVSPGDPYYGWISKIGGLDKKRQMFGIFMFTCYYFAQFVFAMSLLAQAFGSRALVAIMLGVEFCAVCSYMEWKEELSGWSLLNKPSTFNNYIAAISVWFLEYILVCAAPMLITASPNELGPEDFASTLVWRLFTNGGIVCIALGKLEAKGHYLSFMTGMAGYGASLGLVAFGLAMFLSNCDPSFDRSLFRRPKRGKQHVRECCRDEIIWGKGLQD